MRQTIACLLIAMFAVAAAADQKSVNEKIRKAHQQRNPEKAEKLLREAIAEDPNSIAAHHDLADLLFAMRHFSAAGEEYARTAALDEQQHKLSDDDRRRVLDNQGVGFAMGREYDRAKKVYEDAIAKDPDYPLFYYNLACTYAEMGQLDPALKYLREAWKRRHNVLEGESFPDPRQDSSFAKYLNDARFQDAVRDMVF